MPKPKDDLKERLARYRQISPDCREFREVLATKEPQLGQFCA